MSKTREEKWAKLQASLTSLVDELAADLRERDLTLVREFIDNREYGVALEWLHGALAKSSIRVSDAQIREMQRLADLMGIELE